MLLTDSPDLTTGNDMATNIATHRAAAPMRSFQLSRMGSARNPTIAPMTTMRLRAMSVRTPKPNPSTAPAAAASARTMAGARRRLTSRATINRLARKNGAFA